MRFRNTRKWGDLTDLDSLLFFSQRAEELLFDYTLDSYKTPALNSPYLCREAISIINDMERELVDSSNLGHIISELSKALSNDDVAKSLLDLDKSDYLLDHENEKLEKVKLRLEVLSQTLNPARYLEQCKAKLSEAVKAKRKKDIANYSRSLFSTLINMGVHKSYLYEVTVDFFYFGDEPAEINRVGFIDDYLNKVSPEKTSYKVIFIASSLLSSIKDSAEKAFRIKFYDSFPEELQEFAGKHKLSPKNNEVIAEVANLSAFDHYKARELANSVICRLRDVFTLYHHKNQISWRDHAIVRETKDVAPKLVEMPKNPIEKIPDQKPGKASESMNRMLKSFSMESRDFVKFTRVVDFHGLSVNNTDPENQLINLWISLETIVPSHTGAAKIKQVLDSIIPVLGINYFLRLVENLTQDLLRWNRRETIKILNKIPDSKRASLRKKVVLLMLDGDSEDLRNELYERLRDFHLLRFRLFSLSECLKTPDKALAFLNNHEERVAWQVRRIYRTRNLIVHSGSTPNHMHSLIENGHDYLDQVIFMITHMVGSEYKIFTIDQAFELAKLARKKIDKSFKGVDKHDDKTFNILIGENGFA